MPPKKKASGAIGPSTSTPPALEQTGGEVDAGGRANVDTGPPQPLVEQSYVDGGAHGTAKSKEKATLPAGGAANSRNGGAHSKTPTPVRTLHPSQDARDRQHHGTSGARCSLNRDLARRSHD